MGCDIHSIVEKRNKDKWEAVGTIFEHKYNGKITLSSEPYEGRNYVLFAFLAGIRNRFDIKPIDEPRGYPEDISKETQNDLQDLWDSDGHSTSWFTLEELQNADWEQKFRQGGVVPADVYEYLKDINEPPKIYSQGISGKGIVQLTEEEWQKLSWDEKTNGTRWYIYMYWDMTVKEACSEFIENAMEQLKKIGDPKDIRFIFTFDN